MGAEIDTHHWGMMCWFDRKEKGAEFMERQGILLRYFQQGVHGKSLVPVVCRWGSLGL